MSADVQQISQPHISCNSALHILPQELWDDIIGVQRDDKRTLKACRLTCKAWQQTARLFLWRSLSIYTSQTLSRLQSLLHVTPEIAQLVHELDMRIPELKLSFFAVFTNLRRLVTYPVGETWWDGSNNLSINSGSLLPSVTRLVLVSAWNLSPTYIEGFLACFPNIRTFTTTGRSALTWLYDPPCEISVILPHLRVLSVDASCIVPMLPSLLRSTGSSLESLELTILLHSSDLLSEVLDLTRNGRIKSLNLHVIYNEAAFTWGDPLAFALSRLNSSHTSLSEVVYHIQGLGFDDRRNPSASNQKLLGRELARVLEDLPQLVVVFHMEGWAQVRPEQQRQLIVDGIKAGLEAGLDADSTLKRLRILFDFYRARPAYEVHPLVS
ncbi:hypothetical protein DAEQUDRAFT_400983 [Daedalea quercina L-15889]|uniref:F-box domain-containing protein n=1 Tax=Daedalea quercina L-15889 TaxID=1314783 RepID=A0A165NQK5_9APHY|nr:hypothetical protein DAEQUDRAFT_400983 [Daedalea quercina L-15889]